MNHRFVIPASLTASLLLVAPVLSQAPAPSPTPTPPSPTPNSKSKKNPPPTKAGDTPAKKDDTKPKLKPYSEIITKDAKTDDGLFKTHLIDDKVYFEIPKSALGQELLWVTTFAKTQTGYGYGGTEVQNRVVRWEKRGDKILLRSVDYQVRSQADGSIRRSLELATLEPILMVFDVKTYGANDAPVIEATPLLTSDVTEFSPKKQLGASRLDAARTFIDKVKSFPSNIELSVLATYVGGGSPAGQFIPRNGPGRDTSSDAITVVLHHSIVTLPEKPMKPRLEDSRVGFFSTTFYDFGTPENRVKELSYINRWRLEKKDPTAAVSEPVKPIVYYIGPEVPEKWRPYIKKGVEAWQVAFEAAGFKNAIIAKDAPTATEDPQFDPDDVRYSVIRWLPSTVENAYGPSIVDPRSGEILNANIKFFHNVLKLAEDWYFVQASPNDPNAHKLPLSPDLEGQLLQYVVTHEVGHTLGFPHNFKASSSFSVKQLRDPEWTKQWGTEASIMDYGRFNYVAQPGDGATLIPKIGPYDIFAAEWGYKPLDAATPEAEKPMLDQIATRQVTNPMFRFGNADPNEDPARQSEDLSDDAVAATILGFKNLDRVLDYIVPATSKLGEDYAPLQDMYNVLLNQRTTELIHVTEVIGGVNETNWHYGHGDAVYTPVPMEKQRAAMQFLVTQCFATPKSLLRPEIVTRLEASGVSDRILRQQTRVLAVLMSENRVKRMMDQSALQTGTTYTAAQMMEEARKGIWSELVAPVVVIDPFRRNLQRAYIVAVGDRMKSSESELRPLARAALYDTKAAIKTALLHTTDRMTRLHLEDCNQILQQMLYPKS